MTPFRTTRSKGDGWPSRVLEDHAQDVVARSYRVRLKFAEIWFTSAGQRLAHVDLNGTRVLTNFDVYAAAGGPKQSVDREFPVTVTNGQVQIVLTAVASSATVRAIEIVGARGRGSRRCG